jgi:hypothetical protein
MKIIKLLFIFTFISKLPIKAQDLNAIKLGIVLYTSYDEIQNAYQTIHTTDSIVKLIDNGQSPNITFSTNWGKLANKFKEIATQVRNEPLVTDFNEAPYVMSLDEITNCYLREQNLNKLKMYSGEFSNAIKRARVDLEFIAKYKTFLLDVEQVLKNLADAATRLSNYPVYSSIFPLHWYDVEAVVKPALGDLKSAIDNQEKKISKELNKITTQNQNLISNTNLLDNSICKLEGTFMADCYPEPIFQKTKITLQKINDGFAITVSFFNKAAWITFATSELQITSKTISFKITSGNSSTKVIDTYSGDLSRDYKSIVNFGCAEQVIRLNTGAVSSEVCPNKCTLTK